LASAVVNSGETKQCHSASTDAAVNNEMQTADRSLSVRLPQDSGSSDFIPLTSSLASVLTDLLESPNFGELSRVPKLTNRNAHQGKRKVAHVTVVTSSPFKEALELAKKKKEASNRPLVKEKLSKPTKKGSRGNAGRRKVKESDSEDEPLSQVCKKCRKLNITSANSTKCHSCNVPYGDPGDLRSSDDWIQCCKCSTWLHETCAECYGVFDDTDCLCKQCV